MAQRRTLFPAVRPQCLRAMAVGGGPCRPLMAFASVRTSDSSPILVVLDAEPDLTLVPVTAAAVTAATANANAEANANNAKDYAQAHAGASANATANAIGNAVADANGIANASTIANANAKAKANATASAIANGNAEAKAYAVAGATAAVAAVEEVALSTRCCSKNVVSANPHAVWVNPAEVKVFLSCRDRGVSAAAAAADTASHKELSLIHI